MVAKNGIEPIERYLISCVKYYGMQDTAYDKYDHGQAFGEREKGTRQAREDIRHSKGGAQLYLREKNSRKTIDRLKELQKSPLKSTIQEDLRLIRADRDR